MQGHGGSDDAKAGLTSGGDCAGGDDACLARPGRALQQHPTRALAHLANGPLLGRRRQHPPSPQLLHSTASVAGANLAAGSERGPASSQVVVSGDQTRGGVPAHRRVSPGGGPRGNGPPLEELPGQVDGLGRRPGAGLRQAGGEQVPAGESGGVLGEPLWTRQPLEHCLPGRLGEQGRRMAGPAEDRTDQTLRGEAESGQPRPFPLAELLEGEAGVLGRPGGLLGVPLLGAGAQAPPV